VFLGRWVAGLRIAAAWLAGINRMHWLTFFFWNALGGIAWATSVGLAAYYLGHAAAQIVKDASLIGIEVAALGARRIPRLAPQARDVTTAQQQQRHHGTRGARQTGITLRAWTKCQVTTAIRGPSSRGVRALDVAPGHSSLYQPCSA
jgi:hypothetical protein